mmetsp:Transcript_113420/g.222403  ORF Transcript_113420/g.222403 Transcript_113420/m.222403 type:complete len:248 (-) Transcript_113420:103-846(-)
MCAALFIIVIVLRLRHRHEAAERLQRHGRRGRIHGDLGPALRVPEAELHRPKSHSYHHDAEHRGEGQRLLDRGEHRERPPAGSSGDQVAHDQAKVDAEEHDRENHNRAHSSRNRRRHEPPQRRRQGRTPCSDGDEGLLLVPHQPEVLLLHGRDAEQDERRGDVESPQHDAGHHDLCSCCLGRSEGWLRGRAQVRQHRPACLEHLQHDRGCRRVHGRDGDGVRLQGKLHRAKLDADQQDADHHRELDG